MPTERKKRASTKDVLKELRKDIILYKYKDGEFLKEVEVAQHYGCSRAAIRSAVLVLQKEGLVMIHENGTKTVSTLTLQDVEDIYDMRRYLELSAVKKVANGKPHDYTKLFEIVNAICNANDSNDNEYKLDLDIAFHTAMVEASGSKALTQSWNNISSVIREIFSFNMTSSKEYRESFCKNFKDDHMSLMSSLLVMDQENEAYAQFEKHIENAYHISLQALEKSGRKV